MAKKYIVRDGFVVVQSIPRPDGTSYDRTYAGGEECTLEDADAALHAHKLEFASQKDRDAALAAEKSARVAAAAASNPAELLAALTMMLQQAQAAAAPAPATASQT